MINFIHQISGSTRKSSCRYKDALQPIQFFVRVLTFKAIQGRWFSCHFKANVS